MKRDGLLYRIREGIYDTCYIMVQEVKNEFRDEGLLIFCVLVPLFYPLLYSWIYNNEVVRDVPGNRRFQSQSRFTRVYPNVGCQC